MFTEQLLSGFSESLDTYVPASCMAHIVNVMTVPAGLSSYDVIGPAVRDVIGSGCKFLFPKNPVNPDRVSLCIPRNIDYRREFLEFLDEAIPFRSLRISTTMRSFPPNTWLDTFRVDTEGTAAVVDVAGSKQIIVDMYITVTSGEKAKNWPWDNVEEQYLPYIYMQDNWVPSNSLCSALALTAPNGEKTLAGDILQKLLIFGGLPPLKLPCPTNDSERDSSDRHSDILVSPKARIVAMTLPTAQSPDSGLLATPVGWSALRHITETRIRGLVTRENLRELLKSTPLAVPDRVRLTKKSVPLGWDNQRLSTEVIRQNFMERS